MCTPHALSLHCTVCLDCVQTGSLNKHCLVTITYSPVCLQITERQRKEEGERLRQQWEEEQERYVVGRAIRAAVPRVCTPPSILRLAEEEQDVLIREEIENVTGRHAHCREPHPPDHMTYRPYSGRNTQYAWY